MKTSTCTSCMGRGVETDFNSRYQTTKNSYAYRDKPCVNCSGSGVIYDYSPPEPKTTTKKTSRTSSKKSSPIKKKSGSDFSMNDFFMLVGFIIGGISAYQVTHNWIAIGITAIITGVVLRITYKLIFIVLVLLAIFYFYNQ